MRTTTHKLIFAALFAALTAVGAFIRIPLGIMAITLQFFCTAMAGVLLGARWGALSQCAYVGMGLVGLPVFLAGGGIGYVLQPSFGFLLGLIPAAWVIGRLSEGSVSTGRLFAACAAGLGVLYAVGLPYLYVALSLLSGKALPLAPVVWTGMVVYLPGDCLKILLTVLLAKPLRRALR